MGRVAAGGRNWEGFGAGMFSYRLSLKRGVLIRMVVLDPYLAGEGAYAAVQGLQSQGVQACAKHLINK
jgi:beta-glucosidase